MGEIKIRDELMKKILILVLALAALTQAAEYKHIVFIYSAKVKQVGVVADVASVPLFRVGDRDSTVVAYAGVLWEFQIPAKNKVAIRAQIAQKPVYIAISEPMEADQIDHWLEQQGYKRVVEKEDKVGVGK